MAVGATFIIFQLLTFLVVFNECKINELYRWKQMSYGGLGLGENVKGFFSAFLKDFFVVVLLM